jgi:hypothetical protein
MSPVYFYWKYTRGAQESGDCTTIAINEMRGAMDGSEMDAFLNTPPKHDSELIVQVTTDKQPANFWEAKLHVNEQGEVDLVGDIEPLEDMGSPLVDAFFDVLRRYYKAGKVTAKTVAIVEAWPGWKWDA